MPVRNSYPLSETQFKVDKPKRKKRKVYKSKDGSLKRKVVVTRKGKVKEKSKRVGTDYKYKATYSSVDDPIPDTKKLRKGGEVSKSDLRGGTKSTVRPIGKLKRSYISKAKINPRTGKYKQKYLDVSGKKTILKGKAIATEQKDGKTRYTSDLGVDITSIKSRGRRDKWARKQGYHDKPGIYSHLKK